mmetsp:Transcript_58302/g.137223  ORF Transcript_58302/g.137223 Transcript_58302/m.137223 type:complete len:256 (+) Transcript_58302:244-1011(+)
MPQLGLGCEMLQLEAGRVRQLWFQESRRLREVLRNAPRLDGFGRVLLNVCRFLALHPRPQKVKKKQHHDSDRNPNKSPLPGRPAAAVAVILLRGSWRDRHGCPLGEVGGLSAEHARVLVEAAGESIPQSSGQVEKRHVHFLASRSLCCQRCQINWNRERHWHGEADPFRLHVKQDGDRLQCGGLRWVDGKVLDVIPRNLHDDVAGRRPGRDGHSRPRGGLDFSRRAGRNRSRIHAVSRISRSLLRAVEAKPPGRA